MATLSISLQSTMLDQDVLCVTTVLPSYLFVFHLNRVLKLSLVRTKKDLLVKNCAGSFAVYEYDCDVMQQTWRVVENQFVSTACSAQEALFNETEERSLLFAGLSQTDLLVCVNGMTHGLIKKIRSISRVMSCSPLPKKLDKIKEKLTF